MAPVSRPRLLARDRFPSMFSGLKTQQYVDPVVRASVLATHKTISWNFTGSQIATGATDKTIRIWNPEKPQPKQQIELKGHSHSVEKVLYNPVKEFELASCSKDGTVRFWDTKSRTCTTKLDMDGEAISLSWSVDGTVLIVGVVQGKHDIIVPVSTPSAPTILARHRQNEQTNQTCFSNTYPPQDLFLTTSTGMVRILDYPSFTTLHTLAAHTSACMAIAYSPSGRYVAVGGSDALISIWDTTDWVCKRTVSNSSSGAIRALSWSWDGRYLVGCSDEVSSGDGGGISTGFEIYHAETGDVVYTVSTGSDAIWSVEWHPNRYWLAYTQREQLSGKSSLKIIGAAGGPNI